MAVENGNAFIIVHVDLDDITNGPRVEITGMSLYAADRVMAIVSEAIYARLGDADVFLTRDGGDIEIIPATVWE
jgi:hypothetical protein